MLLLSMFISHIPPSNVFHFVFQKLFVFTISIKRFNAMPLRSNTDVLLKIMKTAELFIVMTTATG